MKLQRSFISNSRKNGIIVYYYLYCITKALHKPLMNVVGVGNANVHALQYEDIVAILSEVTMAKIPVSNGNVLRHAAVIEDVRKEQTVLPMRFSSVFKDNAGVIEFLKNRYAVFISDLERLHDTLEMGIRVIQKKVTVHPHISFSQGVSLHYLIHKDSLNEFKNRFNDLKSSLNELHFLCSGPWPPYHFVSPGDGRE